MNKTILFLSHITEEKILAKELKSFLEKSFLKTIEIFVSSDSASIKVGDKWLDNISKNLSDCKIMFVLCSPRSIARPWINFESGAGWVRKIPVVPICHSGLRVSNLPTPLNQLQGINISEKKGIENILERISKLLNCEKPEPNIDTFILKCREFEANYCFWDNCNEVFSLLKSIDENLLETLHKTPVNEPLKIYLTDDGIDILTEKIKYLEEMEVLSIKTRLASAAGPNGTFFLCHLIPLTNYNNVIRDNDFKFK